MCNNRSTADCTGVCVCLYVYLLVRFCVYLQHAAVCICLVWLPLQKTCLCVQVHLQATYFGLVFLGWWSNRGASERVFTVFSRGGLIAGSCRTVRPQPTLCRLLAVSHFLTQTQRCAWQLGTLETSFFSPTISLSLSPAFLPLSAYLTPRSFSLCLSVSQPLRC